MPIYDVIPKSALCALLFCISLTSPHIFSESLAAESWGNALFPVRRHDFGRVPLGADAEFQFQITNPYSRDVRLLSVRSSCNCTAAILTSPILKPGETGAVIAKFNTTGQHIREKSAVLTIQLETVISGIRRFDTVQLFITGFIRPDVLLSPGSVEFGTISEGATAERTVFLEYAGRTGWALTKIERAQPFIYAKAEEISRNTGKVTYKITVTLKENAPAGYVRDVLRFTTNEKQPGKMEPIEITLPLQGEITAPINVKPSPMLLGILSPGETATKSVAVRSKTPFRITDIVSKDKRFRFAFSDQESFVQLISVAFSAGLNQPKDISEEIRIITDNAQQKSLTIQVYARIMQ